MIIPAVDLINGQVVRLFQGDYEKKTLYANDPVPLFQQWVEQGATHLHLVDLDGAENPANRQVVLIKDILSTVNAFIQVGGGIRTKEEIKILLDTGAHRVVLGSIAITQPLQVKNWIRHFGPEKIVLALDVNIINNRKEVAIHGWKKNSHKTIEQVIEEYNKVKLQHILCTDISRDGALKGSNTTLYQQLVAQYPHIAWQASGGVDQISHIPSLKRSGVKGVIIGRALLENNFTVKEAISCWQEG